VGNSKRIGYAARTRRETSFRASLFLSVQHLTPCTARAFSTPAKFRHALLLVQIFLIAYFARLVCQLPDLFYKGRSQEKKRPPAGWKFPCFAAQLIKRDLFRSPAPCARLPGGCARRFGILLPAVFIACRQRNLSVPKPTKLNGAHSSGVS